MKGLRKIVIIAALLIAAGLGWFTWKKSQASNLPPGIAFGNGRIEANACRNMRQTSESHSHAKSCAGHDSCPI